MNGRHLSTGSIQPPLVKGKLRLYSMRFCPFAQRAHLILDAKGIPYDTVFINLSVKPQWYLDKAGGDQYAKVPMIELEDGTLLAESLIVAEYLDEAYPGRQIRSADPLQRAKDKLLIERFSAVIGAMYEVQYGTGGEKAENTIAKGLEMADAELVKRGTKFFGGALPGWLDYMVWPWCERAEMLPLLGAAIGTLDPERFPNMAAWRRHMTQDEAVQKSMLSVDIHLKYLKGRKIGKPDYNMLVEMDE